jgi:type II secretory pathway pseudopilin PulG
MCEPQMHANEREFNRPPIRRSPRVDRQTGTVCLPSPTALRPRAIPKGGKVMNTRGTVMLMLLVAVLIGGILALRLVPTYEVQQRRESDTQLRLTLGQIRQAFDMKLMVDPTYNPVLDTPADVANALKTLANENFLLADSGDFVVDEGTLRDLTIPKHLWKKGDQFWTRANNVASNTSFEELDTSGEVASWTAEPNTIFSIDEAYLDLPDLDDYPGQNKLGVTFGSQGKALKIVN